jgi:hypothetical protein
MRPAVITFLAGFSIIQEIIDDEEHPDYVELVHSHADSGETGLSAMGARMAKVERAAQSMGVKGTKSP